jgi:hypothetical protein
MISGQYSQRPGSSATSAPGRPHDPAAKESDRQRPLEPAPRHKDRPWHPLFWEGMFPTGWFPALARNRFCISPRRAVRALNISCRTLGTFLLWAIQAALLGRRIAKTRLQGDPIFIIGHWRSGTTLLHELLALDEQYSYANTYDCFAPNHFLISARFLRPLVGLRLPKRRPMDNMAAGCDCPQEDEFALCNMGLPSPYLTILFCNRPPQNQEYFDLERVSPQQRRRWQRGLLWFLKCLTLRTPKRIVLKSPPHTFRIRLLLALFPAARFIHIVRSPYVIFPSTVHLWKRLYREHGLQVPKYEGLEEYVFQTFQRMYEVFERDRHLIPSGQLCEIRYEDLIADPIEQMRTLYHRLAMGEFERVRPAMEAYFAQKADYQTNRYELSAELQAEITRRWGWFAEKYGYPAETTELARLAD